MLEAVTIMADSDISALMVLRGEQVEGIITERDFVRRVARLERSAYATTVSEVMTSSLITVGPQDRTRFCMQLMIERNLRHLPVLEDGKLVGLLVHPRSGQGRGGRAGRPDPASGAVHPRRIAVVVDCFAASPVLHRIAMFAA